MENEHWALSFDLVETGSVIWYLLMSVDNGSIFSVFNTCLSYFKEESNITIDFEAQWLLHVENVAVHIYITLR